jgi:hypothetical protein
MQRRYRRRDRDEQSLELGPGDPGYRTRPGASGLDPLATYQEMGRVIGITVSAVLRGRVKELGVPLPLFLPLALLSAAVWTSEIAFAFVVGIGVRVGSLFGRNGGQDGSKRREASD